MNSRLSAAVLACLAPLAVCGCRMHVSADFSSSDAVKKTTTASSPVDSATKLEVHESFGSIKTTSKPGNKVELTAEVSANGRQSKEVLKSWLDKARIEIVRKDSALVVELRKPDGLPKDISIYASYDITLPPSFEQELKSDNGAVAVIGPSQAVDAGSSFGEITVTDVQAGVSAHSSNGRVTVRKVHGDVEARSSFGEIETKSIQGRVTARTDNGSIDATDIDGDLGADTSFGEIRVAGLQGGLRAESKNGAVTAKNVRAPGRDVSLVSSFGEVQFDGEAGGLTMRSNNGAVHASLPVLPRQVTMTSSFGEVDLSIPRNSNADVDTSTSFGSVNIEGFAAGQPRGDQKRWSGRLGSGGSSIKLNTNNGSVTLKAR